MSRIAQNILYIIILAAVAITLYALSPTYQYDVHSIYLPATKSSYKAVQPAQVKISNTMPVNAKVIGTVRTMQHFSTMTHSALANLQRNAVRSAVLIASAHGANGLYIKVLGYTRKVSALDGVISYAKALQLTHS